jgi:hypothetical protein
MMTDNMIVGNTAVRNGADTADAATPGQTGINVFSLFPSTGNIISGNTIQNETEDVAVSNPALVQVQFNNLFGRDNGVDNIGSGPVDAVWNWRGCFSGPNESGSCSAAAGQTVRIIT